ncbi:MAG: SGNH/GDSL hydrolase family protein [Thermoanaerobaculia bacterium]|nr:SGNH/GDSL hydrolase family protein [Thermoanaerobaculia bacterium]
MRKVKNRTLLAALSLALLLPAVAAAQADTGSADFSRFVAMGDSLGAGFMSGSLHEGGQRNSWPSLIYQQVNGSAAGFEQPLVSSPGIPGILELRSLVPLVIAPAAGFGNPNNLTLPRPYDNLSVPGFTMGDASQTVTGNPVIDVVLRGLGTQLQQTAFLQPSFVALWLGSNDVLGAALSGVAIEGVTLTPVNDFAVALATVGQTLEAVGVQQGAIATIPNVTSVPFVTTLPPVVVDPAGNPVVIDGQFIPLIAETSTGVRPLGPGDFVLLTATAELAQGRGVPPPLGNAGPLSTFVVLDRDEVAAIQARVDELNALIRQAAQDSGAALVDVNAIFDEVVAEGLNIGGIEYSADFLTGGLFSLDGFHASPMGYAIIANAFIDAINATYGGSIPPVNLSRFVFGVEGQLPIGGGTLEFGELRFSRQAWRSLRKSLRLPTRKELKRALRASQRSETRRLRLSERPADRQARLEAARSGGGKLRRR